MKTANFLLVCAFALGGASALAQSSSAPEPSAAMGLTYRSAFEGYRSFKDEPVGSWREANDTVGRIGGWREYAKEARPQQPAVPASAGSAAPAPGRPTQPETQGGHGKH